MRQRSALSIMEPTVIKVLLLEDNPGDARLLMRFLADAASTQYEVMQAILDKTKPILVKLQILEDRFEIVLRDYGQKAEVERIKSRQLEDVKPGGLGVHIIKSTMDVVNYDNSLQIGNRLTLAKYLPGK